MARPLRRPSPRRRRSSASGSRPPRPGRRCPRSSRSASLTSRASRTLLAFLVAVDVGHYYGEPGVISASGRAEFEYNLELASQLKDFLTEAGLKVRMIGERGDRSEDRRAGAECRPGGGEAACEGERTHE